MKNESMSRTAEQYVYRIYNETNTRREVSGLGKATVITACIATVLGLIYSTAATLMVLALLFVIAVAAYMVYRVFEGTTRVRQSRDNGRKRKSLAAITAYCAFSAVLLLVSAVNGFMSFAEFWKTFGPQILLLPGVLVLVYVCSIMSGEGR